MEKTNLSKLETIDHWINLVNSVGLFIFLLVLPFHLVVKRVIGDPVGTYWKEILLGLLLVLQLTRLVINRQRIFSLSPLCLSIWIYLLLIVLRFVLGGFTQEGFWGLYMSIMYLPVCWLFYETCKGKPRLLNTFFALILCVNTLVAIGGIVEFLINRALWPSTDMVQRQGYADMFIYGTQIRRVYFVFDSPTTLANTLAMLLPIAIYFLITARKILHQWLAGVSALLLALCIVVTFSRGIWVAVAVALVVCVFISGSLRPSRKILLTGVSVLIGICVLSALALILYPWKILQGQTSFVELPRRLYQSAPVSKPVLSLLQDSPAFGEVTMQTWTLNDPIDMTTDQRQVVVMAPADAKPNEVIYNLSVPENGALCFSIAVDPAVWTPEKGDGADFKIYLSAQADSSKPALIFSRYSNPKENPNDRRWRNYIVDLSAWSNKNVQIHLVTSGGPQNNINFDWTGWADLNLVSAPSGYFKSNSTGSQHPLLQYVASIGDWVRDETNRDRLAAWNLGLSAWKQSPIVGIGLGTTGEAALRINPKSAFVTESQVLKALTELGLPGIFSLLFLWAMIFWVGIRAYRNRENPTQKVLLLAVMMGLLIVFIDGCVYQNLEVKQVNAYFWTFIGALSLLVGKNDV